MQMLRVLWANRSQTAGRGEAGQDQEQEQATTNRTPDRAADCQMSFDVPKSKSSAPKVMQLEQTVATEGKQEWQEERERGRKRDRSWADEPAHASATWRMRDIPHSVQAMQYAICHTLLAHVCACPLGHIHIRNPRATPVQPPATPTVQSHVNQNKLATTHSLLHCKKNSSSSNNNKIAYK